MAPVGGADALHHVFHHLNDGHLFAVLIVQPVGRFAAYHTAAADHDLLGIAHFLRMGQQLHGLNGVYIPDAGDGREGILRAHGEHHGIIFLLL